jgi:hypothetical protein
MTFAAKNVQKPRPGQPIVAQWINVSRTAATVPQSTTDILFRVYGGRVLIHKLLGEVTTVISGTDPQLSVLSKKLDGTPAAVGTAVTVASAATIASLEVGGFVTVEGDGTALLKANAGALAMAGTWQTWVAPQGEIYLNAAASSVTGAMKWDLWYQPLDPGAYVAARPSRR